MSYTNDDTSGPPKITLKVVIQGPQVVNFWAQPAPWAGLEPFEAEFDLPTAGQYGASFELHPLWKQSGVSKARSLTTTAHQSSATNGRSSNGVSKRGQSCPSLSRSEELADGIVIQSRCVKRRSTVVPQSSPTVPESPAAVGSAFGPPTEEDVVTLAEGPILPTAADPIDGPSESLPHARQKRRREAGDVGENGRPAKMVRVPGVQDDTRPHNI